MLGLEDEFYVARYSTLYQNYLKATDIVSWDFAQRILDGTKSKTNRIGLLCLELRLMALFRNLRFCQPRNFKIARQFRAQRRATRMLS